MISRRTTKLSADSFGGRFADRKRTYRGSSSSTISTVRREQLYDFLFERGHDAYICNLLKNTLTESGLKETIKKLHTTESLRTEGKWEQKRRVAFCQKVLEKLAADLLTSDILEKDEAAQVTKALELDGYVFADGRLRKSEGETKDVEQERGEMLNLYARLGLSNEPRVRGCLNQSEEHFASGRFRDCISNARHFLERLLRAMHDRKAGPAVLPLMSDLNENRRVGWMREALRAREARSRAAHGRERHDDADQPPVVARHGDHGLALRGVDVAKMQCRAGHGSISTTLGYVKMAEDLTGSLGDRSLPPRGARRSRADPAEAKFRPSARVPRRKSVGKRVGEAGLEIRDHERAVNHARLGCGQDFRVFADLRERTRCDARRHGRGRPVADARRFGATAQGPFRASRATRQAPRASRHGLGSRRDSAWRGAGGVARRVRVRFSPAHRG